MTALMICTASIALWLLIGFVIVLIAGRRGVFDYTKSYTEEIGPGGFKWMVLLLWPVMMLMIVTYEVVAAIRPAFRAIDRGFNKIARVRS